MRRAYRRIARALVAAAGLMVPHVASADALDDLLREQMRAMHVPGLAVAVVDRGQVSTRCYGVADLQHDVPVDDSTVFEIGSLTKQFTAVLALQLVDEGRLLLEDSLAAFFPTAPATWRSITVRQLLTHTSGIREYLADDGFYEESGRADVTHARLADMFFARLPLDFPPGHGWAYSNTGYLLLGTIVEQITGASYFDNLRTRIFQPLDMRETRPAVPGDVVRHRAAGYAWSEGAWHNRAPLIANAYAAGGILSTARDMAKWAEALSAGTLVSPAAARLMETPVRADDGGWAAFNYGFGCFIDSYRGRPVVWHNGGTPGFSSLLHRFPADSLAVIVLVNHGDRVLDQLALDIAGQWRPSLARRDGRVDPDPARTVRMRRLLAGLVVGRVDSAAFTAPFRVFLGTPSGRGLFGWLGEDGPLDGLAFAESERVPGGELLRYVADVGDITRRFSVRVTRDGRIAQIGMW